MTITEPQFFKFVLRQYKDDETVATNADVKNYLYCDNEMRKPGPMRRRLAPAAAKGLVAVSGAYASYPQLQGYYK